jgi:hypothetical protein
MPMYLIKSDFWMKKFSYLCGEFEEKPQNSTTIVLSCKGSCMVIVQLNAEI